jgi:hypothetical protein
MKHRKLKLIALLLFGLGITGVQAQETINATGGNAEGNGGTASYSFGQVFYTTNTGSAGSATQGVQQMYEIVEVTATDDAKVIHLSAYPNPTTDYLNLRVEDKELKDLSFQLFDMSGKLLQSQQVNNSQTSIQMSEFVPAMYFIKVLQGSKEVKSFKIIKK